MLQIFTNYHTIVLLSNILCDISNTLAIQNQFFLNHLRTLS